MTEEVQPVAEEVKTEPAVAAVETTEAKTQDRDENGKFRNPVQPRIDELTRKARENEREAAYWRQRAESVEALKSAPAAPVKPTPDKFTDYNEYVEALADFKADEKVDAKFKAHDEETSKKQALEKRASTWAEQVAALKSTITDYEEVVQASDVPVSDHVKAAIEDSDKGAELVYHLAKHPEVAERLNKLGELGAAREIGRIEASLTKPETTELVEETDEPAPVRKTTSAPPPAKPLSSGRSTATDLAKLGMDDYVKQRKSQGARWAR